jgi:hypothetical protein
MIVHEQPLNLLGKPIVRLSLFDLARSSDCIHDTSCSCARLSGTLVPMTCITLRDRHRLTRCI